MLNLIIVTVLKRIMKNPFLGLAERKLISASESHYDYYI